MTHKTKMPRRLGDLQLKIMKVLWESEQATIGEVQEALNRSSTKQLAYTTVATMLRKMEARGLVRHKSEGRSFVYEATYEAASVSRGLADELIEKLFEGSLSNFVSHFLSARDVSAEELRKLEQLLKAKKRSQKGD